MSKVSQEGYLFIHSGIFDTHQVESSLKYCINKLKNINKEIKECDLYVNVVENKDGQKFGHTYAWISNPMVYHALIGNNFNGSERVEEIEQEDWSPPKISLSEAIKEANGDWAMEAEIEERYEIPTREVKLEPLVVPPGVRYTKTQKEILGIEDDVGFIEIFPARVTIRSDDKKVNCIYSSSIPPWVSEDMLYKFFERFSVDKMIHKDVKTKKSFSYPKILITKNNNKKWRDGKQQLHNVCIFFSPLDKNISYFVMNIARKILVTNPITNETQMLFFSHTRSRT